MTFHELTFCCFLRRVFQGIFQASLRDHRKRLRPVPRAWCLARGFIDPSNSSITAAMALHIESAMQARVSPASQPETVVVEA